MKRSAYILYLIIFSFLFGIVLPYSDDPLPAGNAISSHDELPQLVSTRNTESAVFTETEIKELLSHVRERTEEDTGASDLPGRHLCMVFHSPSSESIDSITLYHHTAYYGFFSGIDPPVL